MIAWYNEIDRYCCDWLSNLMDAGHIMPGVIDDRSIEDISPDDIRGFERCHFFAGIAGWELALQLAGWPADRPVWTGSCPCQPFSAAGQGKAADDERHLWPAWMALIRECKPPRIFGEQVEAAIGWGWLDVVFADLEAEGYACGAAVLPACGVGAPHIRQRLWFVADAEPQFHGSRDAGPRWRIEFANGGASGLVADAHRTGRIIERGGGLFDGERTPQRDDIDGCDTDGLVGNPAKLRCERVREIAGGVGASEEDRGLLQFTGASPWDDIIWLPCSDGKARPTQPGIFPLAHGIPARVGRLRAYGNAIVPQAAAAFIAASARAG